MVQKKGTKRVTVAFDLARVFVDEGMQEERREKRKRERSELKGRSSRGRGILIQEGTNKESR